jgi:hypothetical protein
VIRNWEVGIYFQLQGVGIMMHLEDILQTEQKYYWAKRQSNKRATQKNVCGHEINRA